MMDKETLILSVMLGMFLAGVYFGYSLGSNIERAVYRESCMKAYSELCRKKSVSKDEVLQCQNIKLPWENKE
jgi:hypothetical protein